MKYQSKSMALLSASQLKYLAAALMLIDHMGMLLFPQVRVLRMIGRLSMPIWCFFIAQGALKTQNPGKYVLRLFLFAVVSEPFYDFFVCGKFWSLTQQNVGFTLLLGLLTCLFASWMHKGEIPFEKLPDWIKKSGFTTFLCFFLTAAAITLSLFINCDYGVYGVLAILIFYLFGNSLPGVFFGCLVPNLLLSYAQLGSSLGVSSMRELVELVRQYGANMTIQWMALFAFIPLMLYNGQRGKAPKWFFYGFYPAHLLILALIHRFFF